jgi:hypothetical protein
MPYYTSPGGPMTARAARALQDSSMGELGILPSINVRAPRVIPAAISAARRYRMRLPASREETVMTGMGAVTIPPGRYAHLLAQPAPVTFATALRTAAAIRAAQIAQSQGVSLVGLGAGAGPRHARPFGIMPITAAGVRHQAAMFMSPGGGYSQIPGFMPAVTGPPMRRLSFLGQDGNMEPSTYTAPTELTPPIVSPPQEIFLIPTPSIPPVPSTYTAPTNLIPPNAGGGPIGVQYKPVTFLPSVPPVQPFMTQSTLGIKNQYLIAAGAGIVLLTVLGRRRRRNPSRRRNRAR